MTNRFGVGFFVGFMVGFLMATGVAHANHGHTIVPKHLRQSAPRVEMVGGAAVPWPQRAWLANTAAPAPGPFLIEPHAAATPTVTGFTWLGDHVSLPIIWLDLDPAIDSEMDMAHEEGHVFEFTRFNHEARMKAIQIMGFRAGTPWPSTGDGVTASPEEEAADFYMYVAKRSQFMSSRRAWHAYITRPSTMIGYVAPTYLQVRRMRRLFFDVAAGRYGPSDGYGTSSTIQP